MEMQKRDVISDITRAFSCAVCLGDIEELRSVHGSKLCHGCVKWLARIPSSERSAFIDGSVGMRLRAGIRPAGYLYNKSWV